MQPQNIIIFGPTTSEEAEALKAFGTALKLKFKICESNADSDRQAMISNITKGLKDVDAWNISRKR